MLISTASLLEPIYAAKGKEGSMDSIRSHSAQRQVRSNSQVFRNGDGGRRLVVSLTFVK